jgi:hydrogenase expression/formation protein HypE
MNQLIERMFLAAFGNPMLDRRHDGAVIEIGRGKIAISTDSYVVHPLFFPGGDIGSMAVHGTVNDLAMCGARPLYLTAAFILEEGLPMETLWRVVECMAEAARNCGVQIVTGDTKVVDRGKGDGLFINTTGVGVIEKEVSISPQSVQPGDSVLLSGDIGRHGVAIMAVREGLAFETTIESDSASVAPLVMDLLEEGVEVHCLRDLTRGGLASALNEIASTAGAAIQIEEAAVPVLEQVRGACEILGLDPFYVANEGRFVAMVPSSETERALDVLRRHPLGADAWKIGEVRAGSPLVTLKTRIGVNRIVDLLSGEQLPRIC